MAAHSHVSRVPSLQAHAGRDSVSQGMIHCVRDALDHSPYRAVRHLQCEYRDGIIWLHGSVPNYFLKQVGQKLVLDCLDGRTSVVNRVQVES